jgi:C4-dicarboxylate-specific signal transduction histidine kinase/CheY-like chemotaxis protein
MLPSANETSSGGAEKPRRGLSGLGLRTRLVLFGTLVTLVTIAGSFALLSLEIRRQTRSHLAELLAQNQRTVLALQKRSLDELLWTSRLMTHSPTLRAAMDTYESERPSASAGRPDLLATVQAELDRTRELLEKDLAVITDSQGKVLAASPALASDRIDRRAFAVHPSVQMALQGGLAGSSAFGVLDIAGASYQIGCVPIVLQEFVIGTLTLGHRIDENFLSLMRRTLQSDVILVLGGKVQGTTLAASPSGSLPAPLLERALGEGSTVELMRTGSGEYVTAALPLGKDPAGHPALLLLLRPLSDELASASRSLLWALCACGALALLLAGFLAWRVSRSVLDPLERFVGFVRSVAETGDHSRRFQGSEESAEVRTLSQAYGLLMDSLQEHEKRLLHQAQEELVRVERLKESEKLASLGRMLSSAAHEINNPLTGVVGNLEILLRSSRLEEAERTRMGKIQKEAHRIVGLVRSLLKVAHRDTGVRTLLDLRQVLEETVALRRHEFSTAGFELRLEVPSTPLRLQGNELELQQVLLNLINNSYDAMKEWAREPVLSIRASLQESDVVVVVEDGGGGMKDPSKVFDHFYTTKEIGKGTGLGLSITHAIIQGHRGRITAENRKEGGARFTVRLPAAIAEAPRQVPPRPVEGPAAATASLPVSVLLVDDEPSILELQAAILTSVGSLVVGVPTAQEAVAQLQRRHYDLIVLDLKLPGGQTGEQLYRHFEKNQPALLPRILFVTGDSASESTRAFLERSGRRFLLKPFSVEDYLHALRETLDAMRPAA